MRNKQLSINMIASIVAFVINMGISFFLTRYIVSQLGKEAYGFIGLITQFVNYASIVTVALNAMGARFITIKIHQNDEEEANRYFNSIFVGNIIMSIIIAIACIIAFFYLGSIFDIPNKLWSDVHISFVLVGIEFIINLIFSVYGVTTFVLDKLFISSAISIVTYVIKAFLVIGLFFFLPPKIFYMNICTMVVSIIIVISNIVLTNRLLPMIKLKKKYFDVGAIIELIKAGIWNVFTKLSQILNTGLDLLLSNILLGAASMGILSISKTIPSCFITFTNTIINIFGPQLTIAYAKNDIKELLEVVTRSVKIMTLFTSVFFAFIVVYSDNFYSLWVPTENANLLKILTILAVFHMPITSGMNIVYSIFTVTNKLKKVSMLLFGASVCNALILIGATNIFPSNISIYFIAGISSLLALLVMLFYSLPYSAASLGLKKTTFFKDLFICVGSNIMLIIVFAIIKYFSNIHNWLTLIIWVSISCIVGLILNLFVILSKYERNQLISKIFKRG